MGWEFTSGMQNKTLIDRHLNFSVVTVVSIKLSFLPLPQPLYKIIHWIFKFSLIPQRLLITPDRLTPICQLQRTQELNLHPVTNYWMKDYDGYHTNQTYEIKSSLSPFRHFDFWNDPIFDFALNTQLNFYFNDIVFKKKVARGIFLITHLLC